MRILYLCPDLGIPVGGRKGAAAHVRGLVGAIAGLGPEVEILTPRPGGGNDLPVPVLPILTSKLAGSLGQEVPKPLSRALGHVWNNVAVESALERRVRARRPDLIYERYSPFSVAGGLVARRLGVPHVLEVNAPLAWEGKRYRRQALTEVSEILERETFANADLIIAVSSELARTLVECGVDPAKILVVPNGVDTDRFDPEGDRAYVDGDLVVGFVGSLKPWHGLEVLIEAFRALADDPSVHLLVVGEGPEAKRVDALADAMPGRVTRVAVDHDQVPDYLRAMDVAVAPYPSAAGFYFSPLKVLEYMATGRPVVASDVGQVSELIDDGLTGILVSPGDASALAAAIRNLLDDPILATRLAGNARLAARREHTWTQRAELILETASRLVTDEPAVTETSSRLPATQSPTPSTGHQRAVSNTTPEPGPAERVPVRPSYAGDTR